jgi:hypothetical protein
LGEKTSKNQVVFDPSGKATTSERISDQKQLFVKMIFMLAMPALAKPIKNNQNLNDCDSTKFKY